MLNPGTHNFHMVAVWRRLCWAGINLRAPDKTAAKVMCGYRSGTTRGFDWQWLGEAAFSSQGQICRERSPWQSSPSISHFKHYNKRHGERQRLCVTSKPSVKVRVGRHLEARVRQQEAGDVGEAGVDVLPDVLQLLVLVLLHLNADADALPAAKYHRR